MRKRLPDVERNKIAELARIALKQLPDKETKEAYHYLKEVRGFSDEVLSDFKLGYVPSLLKRKDGHTHELAGRITIPIYDVYGRLVSLSSRDWRTDAYIKFWHEQFPKSLYIFGLYNSRKSLLKKNKCILVEGEFDAIYLHGVGINTAVSSIGTSLQLYQISLLKRYCDELYIVYDGDSAGKRATEKILNLFKLYKLKYFDFQVVPVYLPKDTDPDDFVKEKGKKKFIDFLLTAKKEKNEL